MQDLSKGKISTQKNIGSLKSQSLASKELNTQCPEDQSNNLIGNSNGKSIQNVKGTHFSYTCKRNTLR